MKKTITIDVSTTITIEFDEKLDLNLNEFVNELEYNFESNTEGVEIVATNLYDFDTVDMGDEDDWDDEDYD